jgi:hypothetical protein
MLERVEIVPTSRKSVRRAVELGCELVSSHAVRTERVLDLSSRGARVRTRSALRRGEEVLMTFVPPNAPRRVSALGFVRHFDDGIAGVEFLTLDRIDESELHTRLRGLPPPLPKKKIKAREELVWVDCLLTWEEDLGDRVNVFEVSERIEAIDDSDLVVAALSPVLTAGAPAYRWR